LAPLALVHAAVKSLGQVSVGAVVSRTVTVKAQLLEFGGAAWSAAVQFTVVVPIAKVDPEAGEQLVVGLASQASLAVAEKEPAAPAPLAASRVRFAGQVTAGAVVSRTVTVKEQARLLGGVAWSLAVQFTVVVPKAKVDPEAGEQLVLGLGSQVSLAVTE
jgi:chitodextrinase